VEMSFKNKKNYVQLKQFIFCLLCCAIQFPAMSQKAEIVLRNKNNKKIIYNSDQKLMAIADGDEIHVMLTGGNVINNSFKTTLNEINDVSFQS
jgi:hypothetical protein